MYWDGSIEALNTPYQLGVQAGTLYSIQNFRRAELQGIVINDPEMTRPFVDAGTHYSGHSGEFVLERMDTFVAEFFVDMNYHKRPFSAKRFSRTGDRWG